MYIVLLKIVRAIIYKYRVGQKFLPIYFIY